MFHKQSSRGPLDTTHIRVVVSSRNSAPTKHPKSRSESKISDELPRKGLPSRSRKHIIVDSEDEDEKTCLSELSEVISSEGEFLPSQCASLLNVPLTHA